MTDHTQQARAASIPDTATEAAGQQPVMMRFEICVPVLPAYVQHYLDDGWTIAEGGDCG